MFGVLAVGSGFAYWLQTVAMATAAEKLVMRLRLVAFDNVVRQHVGWFDSEDRSPGRLVTRLARDAPLIKAVRLVFVFFSFFFWSVVKWRISFRPPDFEPGSSSGPE